MIAIRLYAERLVIVARAAITMLACFLAVCAGAGIFLVVASWAITEIEVKLLSNRFGCFVRFDGENDRQVVALGKWFGG